jgi:DNA-binding transcriptional regulator YhcF (GntR family)
MRFDVRPDSPIPIYEQIIAQVIFGIASGMLEAGMSIPSVRELAVQLTVNPNTVARAFQQLAKKGILAAKPGLGMEVTSEGVDVSRSMRQEIVRERVREALREAVASALPHDEVERLVHEELHRVNGHRR